MKKKIDFFLNREEPLNVDKSIVYMQWKRFKKKANKFNMNCLNWLFKII